MRTGHALALVAAASLGLGACASPPTAVREYILHPVAAEGSPSSSVATPDVAAPPPAHESGPIVAVGPIVIPAYLRRSTIVTREAEQRVETSERHQWAEALDAGFARVLAENLAVPAAQEASKRLLEDEGRFIDMAASNLFLTEEHQIFDLR